MEIQRYQPVDELARALQSFKRSTEPTAVGFGCYVLLIFHPSYSLYRRRRHYMNIQCDEYVLHKFRNVDYNVHDDFEDKKRN